MPLLKNQRQELFAHGLAKGKTADLAYKDAGYKPSRQNAHHLTTKNYIMARVAELQEMAIETVVVDKAWVLAKLVENAKSDNASASNRALELIGKHLGMFVEKAEFTVTNRFTDLTDEEVYVELVGLLGDALAPANGACLDARHLLEAAAKHRPADEYEVARSLATIKGSGEGITK